MKKKGFLAVIVLAVFFATGCVPKHNSKGVELFASEAFDTVIDGKGVSLYTLTNPSGMSAQITNYGARIVALWVADKNGGFQDVVWGFPNIKGYLESPDVFSGPVVGRYGNRIAKGQFTLDDQQFQLTLNNGNNHIHGGTNGLWNRVWEAERYDNEKGEQAVVMTYFSPDGEEGYPGNMNIKVTYTLTLDNTLAIDYEATTDAPTIINLTSHAYFNLHGTSASSTNSHILRINADSYTPTDAELIPTGDVTYVAKTPLDFRTPTPIGERIEEDYEALKMGSGYDHNWVLNKVPKDVTTAAIVYEPSTGIEMAVITDQPGLQFYSGNFMNGTETGKRGDKHNFRTGIALETQNYPDAPNHPNFPSAVLRPGETYKHVCIYAFSVKDE